MDYLLQQKKRTYHWLASNNPVPMSPKTSIHQQKVLLCVWWNISGIVHYELLPSGQTITAEIYSAQLDKVLANRKGVVFHQDNARPYTAKITRETLARLQWEIRPHPPYSLDLAPSDYHLYQTQDFYKNGIYQLVSRWEKVNFAEGDYILE
ncbi:histone-lysine N-methyltransferase SETMAR-like [Hydra vulgaris]|uniref:Histone-lysine N-methyltransferase SETMAR-like n=1 Tax=Hydra vulgaris TaxID=6087 RepID=A0ABM4BV40_HYDVU